MSTQPNLLAADSAFVTARDSFVQSLSGAERAEFHNCSSVTELLDNVRSLGHLRKSQRRLTKCLNQIKTFGDNLGPYFKIIEIFCGAHPEWANIALGALRLVLQLASHFITFFEKLCDAVDKLSALLPRYQDLYNALVARSAHISPNLKNAFLQLYIDLFEFFVAVSRVFSNQYGKIKRTPAVIANLMWKPFDIRFKGILDKMEFDQKVVRDELRQMETFELRSLIDRSDTHSKKRDRQLNQDLEKLSYFFEAETKSRFLSSISGWIASPDYKSRFRQAQDTMIEGTNEWVFSDQVFRRWREVYSDANDDTPQGLLGYPYSQFLWVSGNPGSGKTILASAIAADIERSHFDQDGPFPPRVCYYFFTQTAHVQENSDDAIRALTLQVFKHFYQLEKVYNVFSLAGEFIKLDTKASTAELVDALVQCLPHLPNLYFVLDGIDECSESEKLIQILLSWCEKMPLKVALFSRPDMSLLLRSTPATNRIHLTTAILRGDMITYVEKKVDELLYSNLLPKTIDKREIVGRLVDRAEGMFLWVRLMATYLSSPAMTGYQRLQVINEEDSPGLNHLDGLYRLIHARIDCLEPYTKDVARRALMWTAYSSLSSLEMGEALYPGGWDMDGPGSTKNLDDAIIVSCCGLVEKGFQKTFQFVHLTALRYALAGSTSQPQLPALIWNKSISKAIMSSRCLSYLQLKIPERPLSGEMRRPVQRVILEERYPFLRFASSQWMPLVLSALENYCQGLESTNIEIMIQHGLSYLASKLMLMVWVEVVYTLRGRIDSSLLAEQELIVQERGHYLQLNSSRDLVHLLRDFTKDLKVLHQDWGHLLKNNPSEIWGDVTAFTTSDFFQRTKGVIHESLAPRLERDKGGDSHETEIVEPIFSTAMSSSDASQLAILSIFSPSGFYERWQSQGKSPFYENASKEGESRDKLLHHSMDELAELCSGWIATYETFLVDNTKSESAFGLWSMIGSALLTATRLSGAQPWNM